VGSFKFIMSAKYFYTIKGKNQGSATLEELKSLAWQQELRRFDLLWAEGMAAWQPAGLTTEIFQGLPPDLIIVVESINPPPLPSVAHANGPNQINWIRIPKSSRDARTLGFLTALAIATVVFTFFTVKASKEMREAPQRQAEYKAEILKRDQASQEKCGLNAGKKCA
jgi:hypothetical protein